MKWIYPVKIKFFLCMALMCINLSTVELQSLGSYRYFDIDRYSYKNHPAVRRAKYLLGGTTDTKQDQEQTNDSEKRLENSYNNAIHDPYAYKKQSDEYKGYDQRELQKYTKAAYATRADDNSISQADRENAKFVGAKNQEDVGVEESSRALGHFKLKRLKRLLRNRCLPFGRSANSVQDGDDGKNSDQYGRFLWDLNVYNVYPYPPPPPPPPVHHDQHSQSSGCGGLLGSAAALLGGGGFGGGGGGFGGGLFSDPVAPTYPATPFSNFLGYFAPGIQNILAATAPPPLPPLNNPVVQNDPNVDTGYQQPQPQPQPQPLPFQPIQPFPQRRPNQVYFDSAGSPPLTPAQLVGGVATTVNGLIQQLTGNVQPVYQSPYG